MKNEEFKKEKIIKNIKEENEKKQKEIKTIEDSEIIYGLLGGDENETISKVD